MNRVQKAFARVLLGDKTEDQAITKGSEVDFDRAFSQFAKLLPFTEYKDKREQVAAYADWQYTAIRAIVEELVTVDLLLYVNRSKVRSTTMQNKLLYHPHKAAEYARRKTADGKPELEQLDDHILFDALEQPNAVMDQTDLLDALFTYWLITGQSFLYKVREGLGDTVTGFLPLYPWNVFIVPDSQKVIKGFVYRNNGRDVPIPVEDMIYLRSFDPQNIAGGKGTIEASARAIDTETNQADWNRRLFKNGAMPDAVLETDKTLDEETFERLTEEWQDTFGGTHNSHKTAILEEGLKLKPVTSTAREMEFLKGREFNRDMILAMFRVSPSMLGMSKDFNRANFEAAEYAFTKKVIVPKLQKFVSVLTRQLAVEYDEKLIVGFTDPVPADKEFRLKEDDTLHNKAYTTNEIRAKRGLDPLDGGDVLYRPINEVPLGFSLSDELDERDEKLLSEIKDMASSLDKKVREVADSKKSAPIEYLDEEVVGESRAVFARKMSVIYTKQFQVLSRRYFDRQRREVKRNLRNNFKKTFTKGLDDLLFDKDAYNKRMIAAFSPIYKDLIETFGNQAMLLVSATQTFDADDPSVIRWMEQRATKVVSEINDETEKQLRATLAAGIRAGESLQELEARVQKVMGIASSTRAERIGRTESIRAATFGDIEAWEQTGFVTEKQWYTALDERVCAHCGPLHGKTVGLSKNFYNKGTELNNDGQKLKLDFEDITGAPLHANCRCTLIPKIRS